MVPYPDIFHTTQPPTLPVSAPSSIPRSQRAQHHLSPRYNPKSKRPPKPLVSMHISIVALAAFCPSQHTFSAHKPYLQSATCSSSGRALILKNSLQGLLRSKYPRFAQSNLNLPPLIHLFLPQHKDPSLWPLHSFVVFSPSHRTLHQLGATKTLGEKSYNCSSNLNKNFSPSPTSSHFGSFSCLFSVVSQLGLKRHPAPKLHPYSLTSSSV